MGGSDKPAPGTPPVRYASESVAEIQSQLKLGTAVLVDVREEEEWDAGHVAHAKWLPLTKLRWWSQQGRLGQARQWLGGDLPPQVRLYLYCRSGRRVLPAATLLRQLQYDAWPLQAGFSQLREAGLPTSSDDALTPTTCRGEGTS